MSKEAMRLALEALEWCHGGEPCGTAEAITALREALAGQKSGIKQVIELYDSPDQPSQQEPVAFEEWLAKQHGDPEEIGFFQALRISYIAGQDSITSPPAQRTWVGLTDQEFQWIYDHGRTSAGMMELVEAKLKEKNT